MQTLNTLSLDAKPSTLAIVKADTKGRVSLPVTQKVLTQKGQEVQGQKSRTLQATPSHPVITSFICRAGTISVRDWGEGCQAMAEVPQPSGYRIEEKGKEKKF